MKSLLVLAVALSAFATIPAHQYSKHGTLGLLEGLLFFTILSSISLIIWAKRAIKEAANSTDDPVSKILGGTTELLVMIVAVTLVGAISLAYTYKGAMGKAEGFIIGSVSTMGLLMLAVDITDRMIKVTPDKK